MGGPKTTYVGLHVEYRIQGGGQEEADVVETGANIGVDEKQSVRGTQEGATGTLGQGWGRRRLVIVQVVEGFQEPINVQVYG